MKNKSLHHATSAADAPLPLRQLAPFRQLVEAPESHRKVRIAIPLPRRPACLTRRAMLAALRAAELDEWAASGGDFLDSMHQPID
jgi:hypothetical protein